jgi:hypothetical protein
VGAGPERRHVRTTRRAVSLRTILAEFTADMDGKSDGAPEGGRVHVELSTLRTGNSTRTGPGADPIRVADTAAAILYIDSVRLTTSPGEVVRDAGRDHRLETRMSATVRSGRLETQSWHAGRMAGGGLRRERKCRTRHLVLPDPAGWCGAAGTLPCRPGEDSAPPARRPASTSDRVRADREHFRAEVCSRGTGQRGLGTLLPTGTRAWASLGISLAAWGTAPDANR